MSRFLLPRRHRPIPAGWSRRSFLRSMFFSAGAIGSSSWLAACGNSAFPDGAGLAPVNPPATPPGMPPAMPPATPPAAPVVTPRFAKLGPLRAADANGVRTPEGFSTRVVAINGELPQPNGMSVTAPQTGGVGNRPWHILNDGGAVIARPNGGWIYVSNSEVPGTGSLSQAGVQASQLGNLLEALTPGLGGVGTLVFDPNGTIVDSYSILTNTTFNCAGVITPWNTWLSCEEFANGQVWECDPFAPGSQGVARPALGFFDHEAIAVDVDRKMLYLTEDYSDSRMYRFVPDAGDWPAGAARPALQSGKLQVMVVDGGSEAAVAGPRAVTWKDALNPGAPQNANRDPETAIFSGGEGIWLYNGIVYFATKNDNTIWAYDTLEETVEAIYRHDEALGAAAENNILTGVDNLIVTPQGDVLVAEDGGDLQVVVILPDGTQKALLQVVGQDASEVAGISFTPDGKRMYFTSDRGGRNGTGGYGNGAGMLYELILPDTI